MLPFITMTTVSSLGSPFVYHRGEENIHGVYCIKVKSEMLQLLEFHSVTWVLFCSGNINELISCRRSDQYQNCKVKFLEQNDSTILHTYKESVKSIFAIVNLKVFTWPYLPVAHISVCFCGNGFPQTVTRVFVFADVFLSAFKDSWDEMDVCFYCLLSIIPFCFQADSVLKLPQDEHEPVRRWGIQIEEHSVWKWSIYPS